jgi:hypothetical protein
LRPALSDIPGISGIVAEVVHVHWDKQLLDDGASSNRNRRPKLPEQPHAEEQAIEAAFAVGGVPGSGPGDEPS